MMKKLSALLIALGLALSTLVFVGASPAAAVDRRACVTLGEFRAVQRPMPYAQARSILDGAGTLLTRVDDGFYEGDWVEAGYWDSYWVSDGFGGGYWIDEWVDESYYDEYANWYSLLDVVRQYRKCPYFDRGRGRYIGINYDNYSSIFSGLRLFTKVRYNPWQLVDLVHGFARTGAGMDKAQPTKQARPPKPEPKPLTPDPHPNSGPSN